MRSLVAALERRFYPEVTHTNWDDELFRKHILNVLQPTMTMLDVGAGAGIVREMNFRGLARHVCGIDPDSRVQENPNLDEGVCGTGEAIPYPDETFDVAIADNVVEHLTAPATVFREIARVLKPGGHFLFKTPNLYHYMPTVARLTPTSFHRFYNRLRDRAVVDTFPTQYRANTAGAIRRLADSCGFGVLGISRTEGRPEYFRIAAPLFMLGVVYERAVNSAPAFEPLRLVLIAHLEKKR